MAPQGPDSSNKEIPFAPIIIIIDIPLFIFCFETLLFPSSCLEDPQNAFKSTQQVL